MVEVAIILMVQNLTAVAESEQRKPAQAIRQLGNTTESVLSESKNPHIFTLGADVMSIDTE